MGNVRGKFNFLGLDQLYSASSCFSLTRRREGRFSTCPMRFLGACRLSWKEVTIYLY